MRTYFINGSKSGFVDRYCEPEWEVDELYGNYGGFYDEDYGCLTIVGRDNALNCAKEMFETFSPPSLDEGEKYLIRYDVRNNETGLIRRFERVVVG